MTKAMFGHGFFQSVLGFLKEFISKHQYDLFAIFRSVNL